MTLAYKFIVYLFTISVAAMVTKTSFIDCLLVCLPLGKGKVIPSTGREGA
jgi:hypothetical protein